MKTIHVDFENQKVTRVENIEYDPQELHPDPVMQRIQKKLDPQWWETYRRTIEHYWEECFMYQLEEQGGLMYDPEEAAHWDEIHKE